MEKMIKRALLLILCLPIYFSCTNDEIYDDTGVTEGEAASINLTLDKNDASEIKSRMVGSGVDDNIKYVHILIFNANNGTLKTKTYVPDYNGETISINTLSGNSIIYAVANMSDVNATTGTGTAYFNDVTSVTSFQKKMAKIKLVNNFAEPLLVMCGNSGSTSIAPGQNAVKTIAMNRLSTQIVLNFVKKIPATDRLDISSWEVINAPGYSYIDQKSSDAVTDRTEALSDSNYFKSPEQQFSSVVIGTQQALQAKFYIFENRKGNVTAVTSQKKRNALAPVRATYIRVKGRYSSPEGVKDIIYKIHLGKDSLTDYNVERNSIYTITATVKSANEYSTQVDVNKQDSRVDVDPLCNFDMNELTLDAHFDWRPIRLQAKLGFSRLEVVDATTELPTSDPDKQWLKLSLSPIWPSTAQILANEALKPVFSIVSNLNLTGMLGLMVYAYADEMFDANDIPITTERRLKLKLTFAPSLNILDLDDPSKCYVFTKEIVQKPAMMMDLIGMRYYNEAGVLISGHYMFGMERREEAVLKLGFTGTAATGRTVMMPWGFNGKQMQAAASFDYYRRNGLANTTTLTWKDNFLMYDQTLSLDFGTSLISGLFDPIYNTYAARYCLEKNRDLNGDGFIKGNEIKWYLPARAQLALFWIGKKALNATAADIPTESLWSSTEGNAANALNLNFYNGGTGGVFSKTDILQHVRCIRGVTNVSSPPAVAKSPYVYTNTRVITMDNAAVSAGLAVHVKGQPYPKHSAEDNLNAVAHQFQVALTDCDINGNQVTPGSATMEWYKACGWVNNDDAIVASPATGCNAYWEGSKTDTNTGQGMWRMPTQRELMCMIMLRDDLKDGFTAFYPGEYWSSPNYYTEAWYTNMSTGFTGATNRNGGPFFKMNVRCVRDYH